MNEEKLTYIIITAIFIVLINTIIQIHRERKGDLPKESKYPTERSYRFHNFGRRLGIACRKFRTLKKY
jgi:hypothetical protein